MSGLPDVKAKNNKGWIVLLRDGPLLETTSRGWAKEGSVYVLWRATREDAVKQLQFHKRDSDVPLKEVTPSSFGYECNFGNYENGSYILFDASKHPALPFPIGCMDEEDVEVTLTDPYDCFCGNRAEEAAVIMGDDFWCNVRCFLAHPPEGWGEVDSAVVKTLRATELALENTMNNNDSLKKRLAANQATMEDVRSELCNEISKLQNQNVGDKIAFESVLKEARKHKKESKEHKIRIAELELLAEPVPVGECGHPCMTSTGICGSLTHGWGDLDDNGYWEHPCDSAAHYRDEKDHSWSPSAEDIYNSTSHLHPSKEPTVTDTPLHNSHDNLPSAQKLAKQIKNRTCGVCQKTLANAQGVKHHQRMTDCGAVMAEAYEEAQVPSPFGPTARVTIESEKVQLAQINYKRQVALATITGEIIQVGIKYGSVAAAIIGSVYHLV